MVRLNWRLIAATNLKGTTDSYFFMQDPTYNAHPGDMVMVAFSYGCLEVKIKGTPWHSSKMEALLQNGGYPGSVSHLQSLGVDGCTCICPVLCYRCQ